MLTLKAAKATAAAVGVTIKRNAEWGEFLVYPTGTPRPADAAITYFAADLDDALDTARAMAAKRYGPNFRR